jgi:predicted RNA binding protein YcfA (HicA-like mRNA interferase family)
MSKFEKVFSKILNPSSDNNITFAELCSLLEQLGFSNRIKGSHHIYFKKGIDEIINIQPKGAKAKAYQVKQIRNIILKYKLTK